MGDRRGSYQDSRCRDCNHWWADHNADDTCALCGCDWFRGGS